MKFNDTNKPESERSVERTMSNESDDSSDEVIVKILCPANQADVSIDESPTSSDCKAQQNGCSHTCADVNTTDDEDGDEVFPKVARRPMEFPPSSEDKGTSCLNSGNVHEYKCSHQKLKDNKTEALCHQELSVDTKTTLEDDSASKLSPKAVKERSCHVN